MKTFVYGLVLILALCGPVLVHAQEAKQKKTFDDMLSSSIIKIDKTPVDKFLATPRNTSELNRLYLHPCVPAGQPALEGTDIKGLNEFEIRDCLKAVRKVREQFTGKDFCSQRNGLLGKYDFKKKGFTIEVLPPGSLMQAAPYGRLQSVRAGKPFKSFKVFVPVDAETAKTMKEKQKHLIAIQYIVQLTGHTPSAPIETSVKNLAEITDLGLEREDLHQVFNSINDLNPELRRKLTVDVKAIRLVAGSIKKPAELYRWPESLKPSDRLQKCFHDLRGEPLLFDIKRYIEEQRHKRDLRNQPTQRKLHDNSKGE